MRDPLDSARATGLIARGRPLLVLLSGGGDSVCLVDVALRLGARVSALHVNYGLRPSADDDERFCRELCERLGVPLYVERVELPARGNLQDAARRVRYELAERLAEGDYAAAHTATDQAETVLYRLATSPGTRALLGMPSRRGRLVRPLLGVTRADVRAYLEARGLSWREDPSNADPRFARARLRSQVLPVLRELNPQVELAIAETARQLAEELELVEEQARQAARQLAPTGALMLRDLERLPAALSRHLLRSLASAAAGRPVALSTADTRELVDLARSGGTRYLDVGGGVQAVSEYGSLRFRKAAPTARPEPVELPVPGSIRFGRFRVEARLGGSAAEPGPEEVAVARERLVEPLKVRAWRAGDRMQPQGLRGTKTLQDVFTDRKVPRELRHELPVVESGGEIVWVAGVALGERFAARPGDAAVLLSARLVGAEATGEAT